MRNRRDAMPPVALRRSHFGRETFGQLRSIDVEIIEIQTPETLTALRSEWDALLESCPQATIFQSWAWNEAWWHCLGEGQQAQRPGNGQPGEHGPTVADQRQHLVSIGARPRPGRPPPRGAGPPPPPRRAGPPRRRRRSPESQ
jgi:hypothetical protein